MAAAILRNGCAIRFASERLRCDHVMVMLAIAHDPSHFILSCVSETLWADRHLLVAVRGHGSAIHALHSSLLRDAEIVATACITYDAMSTCAPTFKTNKDFVLEVVDKCSSLLIGPHVQAFAHDTDFLNKVLEITAANDIVLCRVKNLNGKTVMTSFQINFCCELRPDSLILCLGLDRLFEEAPTSGSFIIQDEVYTDEWREWSRRLIISHTRILDITKVVEVDIILHSWHAGHLQAANGEVACFSAPA